MLMSPAMWRKWLKPRLKHLIDNAKRVNPHIHIFYHSDGFIEPVIPELIEIGVDILNPIQPECMNPVKLKRLYEDELSFFGTIGVQTVMPFGTPGDVRRNVREMVEKGRPRRRIYCRSYSFCVSPGSLGKCRGIL